MDNSLVERLGWTLVHFVWEGTAVAVLLAILMWRFRRAPAGLRYGIACMALTAIAALPAITFSVLAPKVEPLAARIGVASGTTFLGGEVIQPDPLPPVPVFPILVGIWAAGVAILSIRLLGSLVQVERWRRKNTRAADLEWQVRANELAKRLGISRAVSLLVSDRISVPSAWGVFKSVIVLPASLMMQLPPHEVETILLHELAHIRRHDYLVNLVQTVVETALFYHPAVWWVSGVVRREREHCCDDVVVKSLGNPIPYARALLHLEERRITLPRPTLSAKGSNLMNRIARILGPAPVPARLSPMASTLAALGILGSVMGGTLQASAQTKSPAPVSPKKVVAKKHVAKKPTAKKGVKRAAPAPRLTIAAKPAPVAKPAPTVKPAIAAKPAPAARPAPVTKPAHVTTVTASGTQVVTTTGTTATVTRPAHVTTVAAPGAQLVTTTGTTATVIVSSPAEVETTRTAQNRAVRGRGSNDPASATVGVGGFGGGQSTTSTAVGGGFGGGGATTTGVTINGQAGGFGGGGATTTGVTVNGGSGVSAGVGRGRFGGGLAGVQTFQPVVTSGGVFMAPTARLGGLGSGQAPASAFGLGQTGSKNVYGSAKSVYKLNQSFSGFKNQKLAWDRAKSVYKFAPAQAQAPAIRYWNYEYPTSTFSYFDGFSGNIEINKAGNVTLDLKEAPIASALRTMAKRAKKSMVIAPGNYSKVTVILSDVPTNKAIDILCKAANATMRLEGGVYYISPKSK